MKKYLFNSFICFFSTISMLSAQVLTGQESSSLESQLIEASKQEIIGNPDKAIELLEKMRSNQEVKATVYYQLARLYLSKSRLEDAVNAINQSVLADPNNKWTRIFQANVFESVGRYNNTAESYDALSVIEPENYTMYDLAALNYVKADQTDKALAVFDRAQLKFGVMPKLCIKKSRILTSIHKEKKAIELLQASIKEYPKHDELYYELYQLYNTLKNNAEAELTLKQLKAINPFHPIFSYQQINQSPETDLSKISNSIDQPNSNLDVIIQSLIPMIKTNDNSRINQLLEVSDKLIAKYPKDAKSWVLKADILFTYYDYLNAIAAYNKAIECSSVPYSVWENLIISMIQLNHWTSLIVKVNSALDFYPNQSFLFYALALAHLNKSELDDAETQAAQFALMRKNNPVRAQEANILMARILDAKGQFEKSEILWKQCLEVEDNDEAILEYCVSKSKNGKPFPQNKLEKAMLNKNLQASYITSTVARIAFNQKDFNKAKKIITDCLTIKGGQTPDNFELASKILKNLGDKDSSRAMLQKALELSDNKEYYNNLINNLN
ncbi:MAG: tetratricopeptide repeat protein [Saprospiraceae bacterium]